MEDVDEMDAGLSELETVLESSDRHKMLLQQDLLPDVADSGLFTSSEIKVDDDVAAASETVELIQKLADTAPVMKPSGAKVDTGLIRRLMKYTVCLVKYAVPLPLLLLVLFGGLYLLCDAWHEMMNDLGLLISPQLKHVRGSPPI